MKRMAIFVALVISVATAVAAQGPTPEMAREAQRRYRAGVQLMQSESWEAAAVEFKAAIGIDPLMALAHYNLGRSRMAQGRYVEAVAAYQDCRTAFNQIASLSQRERETRDRARRDEINELKDSLARLYKQRNAGPNVGTRLEERIRTLESMDSRDLAENASVPAEVMLALGSAYFRQDKLADAEREWKAALVASNKLGQAHNNLAVLYMQTGRFDEAEQAINSAEKSGFRVNPQFKADLKQRKSGR
jgi:Tfp pilus assembly protein PilF